MNQWHHRRRFKKRRDIEREKGCWNVLIQMTNFLVFKKKKKNSIEPRKQNAESRYHNENCRKKLGLHQWNGKAEALWRNLEKILTEERADFIHFFRALTNVRFGEKNADNDDKILSDWKPFRLVFFQHQNQIPTELKKWLNSWRELVQELNVPVEATEPEGKF